MSRSGKKIRRRERRVRLKAHDRNTVTKQKKRSYRRGGKS